jgi:hypothetical protein
MPSLPALRSSLHRQPRWQSASTRNIARYEPPATPPEGEALTIKQAAAALGVATSTIHRWLKDGIIAGEQLTPGDEAHICRGGNLYDYALEQQAYEIVYNLLPTDQKDFLNKRLKRLLRDRPGKAAGSWVTRTDCQILSCGRPYVIMSFITYMVWGRRGLPPSDQAAAAGRYC